MNVKCTDVIVYAGSVCYTLFVEVVLMPTARTKANRKYNEKAYDRLAITIPKGRKSTVEAVAAAQGESVNGLVNGLLRGAAGLTEEEWRAPAAEAGKE